MNENDKLADEADGATLLTLIVTPESEDAIVDWLLARGEHGFTSAPCHGHGVAPSRLSDAEQVAGRRRQTVFWIQLPGAEAATLAAELGRAFPRARVHFWITPVLATGRSL